MAIKLFVHCVPNSRVTQQKTLCQIIHWNREAFLPANSIERNHVTDVGNIFSEKTSMIAIGAAKENSGQAGYSPFVSGNAI